MTITAGGAGTTATGQVVLSIGGLMRWLLLLLFSAPATAAPIVPSFTRTMTSHTETTSRVTETIVSENYSTGFEYSASGVNIAPDGPINPVANTTVNGWTSFRERPNWSIVKPGEAFQFVESLKGPGLSRTSRPFNEQRNHKRHGHGLLLLNNRCGPSQRSRRWYLRSFRTSPTATSVDR